MVRNIFSVVVTVFLATSAFAKSPILKEGAFVSDANKSILKSLTVNKDLVFDHVSSQGFEVYGPKGLISFLTNLKVPFVNLDTQLETLDRDYPSSKEIAAKLVALNKQYPALTQLIEIGKSVDGNPLLVLKISDNAAIDETEPEFKFISSMHGDEITGRELMVNLATDILKEYDTNPKIKELVDSTEIFIMASMNPDGSDRRQRYNADGVDLNRDFPDFSSDNHNTPDGRAVETKAIMAFQSTRQFALSSNFHGGAEVVNYAWDTIPDDHPFKDLLVQISLDYANKVDYIKNSNEFNNGITNGYAWYEVDGGMQDWSYHWYNDLQFTIELSTSKWPSYSQIPQFYAENKAAMLSQINYIHQGAGFKLEQSGVNGEVQIYAVNGANKKDLGGYNFRNSEFYKVLPEGEYSFEVKSPQLNETKTISVAVQKSGKMTPNYVVIK
jgi:hypothetical protein